MPRSFPNSRITDILAAAMRRLRLAVGLLVALLTAGVPPAAADTPSDWRPTEPVELWVTFNPNSTADVMARVMLDIIAKAELSPQPFKIVHMPTGGGAEAMRQFQGRAGTDHTLMLVLPILFTRHLLDPGLGVDLTEWTQLARMGEEPLAIWMRADQKDVRTIDDFVKLARAKGRDFKMTGPPSGTPRALVVEMLMAMHGIAITYELQATLGSTAQLLLDGKADATIHSPAEQEAVKDKAGAKPLAFLVTQRLAGYRSVPTLRETGTEITFFPTRVVAGPTGMSRPAAAWYTEVLRRVFDSAEWQAYRARFGLSGPFMSGEELRVFLRRELDKYARWKMTIDTLGKR